MASDGLVLFLQIVFGLLVITMCICAFLMMMIYIKGSSTKPKAWDNRLYRKERGKVQK